MKEICNSTFCTACGACKYICPNNSIKIIKNSIGDYQAMIDIDFCVNCNRCFMTCPINNKIEKKKGKIVYAAVAKNYEELSKCASGGIAYQISKHIIDIGGIVYGTVLKENLAIYKRATTIEKVIEFRGSKYVSSQLGNTFSEIVEDLKRGKTILFIGLPCQVAGLKRIVPFQYKKNLYLIDLICHGVPETDMLKEHILKRYGKNAEIVSFRDERGDFFFEIRTLKKQKKLPFNVDLYMYGFLNGLSYRESCYNCNFACEARVGDITLGDFWGINSNSLVLENRISHSLVLINTDKGISLFNGIKENIRYEEKSFEEAVKKNEQLKLPTKKTETSAKFRTIYARNNFEKAAIKSWGKKTYKNYLIWKLSEFKNRLLLRRNKK